MGCLSFIKVSIISFFSCIDVWLVANCAFRMQVRVCLWMRYKLGLGLENAICYGRQ